MFLPILKVGMNPDEAYKNKIIQRLTLRIADGLEKGELTSEQYEEISSYILQNIDKTKNNSELLAFLEVLSQKWPIFSNMLTSEQTESTPDQSQGKVEQIDSLIKENKIDEALKVATDANNATDTNTGGGN